jgi:hypothetical protein
MLRPQTMCRMKDPICPRCGNFFRARMRPYRGGGVLGTCMNRHRTGARDVNCGQRLVLLPADGDLVTVIGVTREEFDALMVPGRPIGDVLEELGIVTVRAW